MVDLGNAKKIAISTWNGFVHVELKGVTSENFRKSLGLLGSHGDGVKLDQSSSMVLKGLNAFGQKWQALSSKHVLFHDLEEPQHPRKI